MFITAAALHQSKHWQSKTRLKGPCRWYIVSISGMKHAPFFNQDHVRFILWGFGHLNRTNNKDESLFVVFFFTADNSCSVSWDQRAQEVLSYCNWHMRPKVEITLLFWASMHFQNAVDSSVGVTQVRELFVLFFFLVMWRVPPSWASCWYTVRFA